LSAIWADYGHYGRQVYLGPSNIDSYVHAFTEAARPYLLDPDSVITSRGAASDMDLFTIASDYSDSQFDEVTVIAHAITGTGAPTDLTMFPGQQTATIDSATLISFYSMMQPRLRAGVLACSSANIAKGVSGAAKVPVTAFNDFIEFRVTNSGEQNAPYREFLSAAIIGSPVTVSH
jgi:hypothetical protein